MKCKRCGGSGDEPDLQFLKEKLESTGLTQSQCASRMGITASYLSDLLGGRRDWDAEKLAAFKNATRITKLTKDLER